MKGAASYGRYFSCSAKMDWEEGREGGRRSREMALGVELCEKVNYFLHCNFDPPSRHEENEET